MDETAFYFETSMSSTLDIRGTRSVSALTVNVLSTRATAILTVCADGSKVPPMIVFKGKHKKTVWRELNSPQSRFPETCFYTTQENAWLDEAICLEWIARVWAPFVKNKGLDRTLSIWDSYKTHMMSSVAEALARVGTKFEILPGGCTSAEQAVDNGVNKPMSVENE